VPLEHIPVEITPGESFPGTKKARLRHKVKAIFISPSKPKNRFQPPVENVVKQMKMKDLAPHPDYVKYGWVDGDDPRRPAPEYPLISQYYGRLVVPKQPGKSAELLGPEPKLALFYQRKLSRPHQVPVRRPERKVHEPELRPEYGVAKAIGWIKTLKEDSPVGCSADVVLGHWWVERDGKLVKRPAHTGRFVVAKVYREKDEWSMSMMALDMLINKRISSVAGEDKRVWFVNMIDGCMKGEPGLWYLLSPPMHRSLADFFRVVKDEGRTGCIRDEVTMTWAKQLAVAADFLHSLGVIHRDIAPDNILFDFNLNLKLTDFNQAYMSPTKCALLPGIKYARAFKGTPGYMAPEVLQCRELYEKDRVSYEVGVDEARQPVLRYGVEADWWSVGCVLAEMFQEGPLWGVSGA
jgi:serine/threonine protein kinase